MRIFKFLRRLAPLILTWSLAFAGSAQPGTAKKGLQVLSPVELARLQINRAAFPDHVTGVKLDVAALEALERWNASRSSDPLAGEAPPPLVVTAGPYPGTPFRMDLDDDRDEIEYAVAQADLVIIGHVLDEATFLTKNREFLFGQFSVGVEEVLKGQPRGDLIRVVRPGGTAVLDGVTIRAIDNLFKPFVVGDRYLMILRSIPESESFLADFQGTFRLEGERVFSMCRGPALDRLVRDQTPEGLREHVLDAVFERKGGDGGIRSKKVP